MLAEQHIQNDAVDLIVLAEQRQHLHGLALLPIAIDAAFSLLMARWIPTEVVVNYSIKLVLQVDAFTQTVSSDHYPPDEHQLIVDAIWADLSGRGQFYREIEA
jgi:hypothetical protein